MAIDSSSHKSSSNLQLKMSAANQISSAPSTRSNNSLEGQSSEEMIQYLDGVLQESIHILNEIPEHEADGCKFVLIEDFNE